MKDSQPLDVRPPSEEAPGGADVLHGTHSAIGVALALLDELLQLLPERPDPAAWKEVEDVLREIRDLAGTGLRIVRTAVEASADPNESRSGPL